MFKSKSGRGAADRRATVLYNNKYSMSRYSGWTGMHDDRQTAAVTLHCIILYYYYCMYEVDDLFQSLFLPLSGVIFCGHAMPRCACDMYLYACTYVLYMARDLLRRIYNYINRQYYILRLLHRYTLTVWLRQFYTTPAYTPPSTLMNRFYDKYSFKRIRAVRNLNLRTNVKFT